MLTAQEAARLLLQSPDDYATPKALDALVAQVSVASFGGVPTDRTVFYSGAVQDDDPPLDAWTLARAIQAQDPGVLIIDRTERGVFLGSQEFQNAVLRAFEDEGFIDFADVGKRRDSKANAFLFDATQGVWAQASEAFAQAAEGSVTTLTSRAPAGRTFARVELPALLANPKVRDINGIDRAVLQELAQGPEGQEQVLRMVAETSRRKLLQTALARNGKGGIAALDSTKLLDVPASRGRPDHATGVLEPIRAGTVDVALIGLLDEAVDRAAKAWALHCRGLLGIRGP